MVDLQPTPFTTASPVLANYNYNDIINGTGFVKYYGGHTSSGYTLSIQPFYSEKVMTFAAIDSTTAVKAIDLDFDLLFNSPRTIRGVALLNVGVGMKAATQGAATRNRTYVVVRIRKWDGTNETEIATAQSTTWTEDPDEEGAEFNGIFSVSVDIPHTDYSAGETLRITVELWAWESGYGGLNTTLTHDPKNRSTSVFDDNNAWDFGADSTIMEVTIPFKLDL